MPTKDTANLSYLGFRRQKHAIRSVGILSSRLYHIVSDGGFQNI